MKNYLIGVVFLVLAFYLIWEQGSQPVDRKNYPVISQNEIPSVDQASEGNQTWKGGQSNAGTPTSFASNGLGLKPANELGDEILTPGLSTDLSSLVFSNHTGSIRSIQLHKSDRLNKAYDLNHSQNPLLGIALEDNQGNLISQGLPNPRGFEIVEETAGRVVFRWVSSEDLQIDRIYERDPNNGYLINHRTIFKNLRNAPMAIDRVRMFLGSSFQIPRMYNPFDQTSTYLSVGYYNDGAPLAEGCSCATCSGRIDGEKEEFFQLNEMGPSGKIEPRRLSKVKWACVNNQFFVNILKPESDLTDFRVMGESVQKITSDDGKEILGISGAVSFPLGILKPGEPKEFSFSLYAGPKDYVELSKLSSEQKKVMQFGIFWWISEPLSWSLNKLSALLGSYGFGIIALTILVKLILWPLTAQATRSQKKMQALQGPLSKLREKHKGSPQKLNQEMMKFYKEHKVNPFAGCWPILIQIPIFLGMFWMLRSAAELYGQQFLWATDLSEQDNVAMLQGFSLNILPIFMVITQWYQMRLNPMQLGPEMSEAQRINAKMMRFMPFMFLVFLYFFSSALVLYWTIQNLMTILQTLITKTNTKNLETENASTKVKSLEEKEPQARLAISDEERRYRNLLGLKSKGSVNLKKLEENFKIRMVNYEDKKLSTMSASKRRTSLDKKERLQEAYDFLKESVDKQS